MARRHIGTEGLGVGRRLKVQGTFLLGRRGGTGGDRGGIVITMWWVTVLIVDE